MLRAGVLDLMAGKTKIGWTDATWNPITGCTKVSPGCDNCYAQRFAERWRGIPGHHFEQGFDLKIHYERFDQPYHWKKPRRIFVNSMSDLFHGHIPQSDLFVLLSTMEDEDRHTYQVLTKRAGRMHRLINDWNKGKPPLPNLWLGVSVENQEQADRRIPLLLNTSAAVRFVSVEPLLGPVDLGRWIAHLDWVIVGGESGPRARQMSVHCVANIRDLCVWAGVPFFFKQWGGTNPKAKGRELDGRTWDEMPGRA